MQKPLESLSKKDLITLLNKERKGVEKAHQRISELEFQLAQYKRLVYGQKRERFVADQNQMCLPFEMNPDQVQQQEEEVKEKLSFERRKRKSAHQGRMPLPDHLEVREVEIFPEEDYSDMVCIGQEVTDELEYEPAKFYIKRYIRYKYAPKSQEGVLIGSLPARVIEKGIPGSSLLAILGVEKYMDHLPLFRIQQRFKREKIPIPSSTIGGWMRKLLELINIVHQCMLEDTRAKGYLQVDETTIQVLDKAKKGTTHRGYYWVYHCPVDGTVLFDYQPGRSTEAAQHILGGFKGYLQSDGYKVYESYGKKEGVTHLFCMAHARREFEKALDNDKQRAETALLYIQKLYAVERKAREKKLTPEERKELRLNESLPIINEYGKWLIKQYENPLVLPKSQIGKAINYSLSRWEGLCAYLHDGMLEIDNNLVENAIRPVAIGRKNYLFAGSHDAAQRAAGIYSFFAMCKYHEVNPYEWLKYTLENILDTKPSEIRKFYPQNYKKLHQG